MHDRNGVAAGGTSKPTGTLRAKRQRRTAGVVRMRSALSARIIRADGTIVELGIVSRRVITNAGVNYLAAAFTGTGAASNMNFHDCGTGTNAEATSDTVLQTPFGGARVSGTQTTPGSTNIYQTVATISFSGSFAITEHGIFSASSAGTLWDRSKFAAINVVNGDSIQFTYQLTLTSGG